MGYLEVVLDRLAASDVCGYHAGAPAATEPTAVAALALFAHGRVDSARKLADRLLEIQKEDGSLGIDRVNGSPGWPTSWAILAWRAAQSSEGFDPAYVTAYERGRDWLLGVVGDSFDIVQWEGHDSQLRGWPWVKGTHSWVEPTALALLALRLTGKADSKRARDAALLLVNRLLPEGGCNYGNTIVFGQALRPHLQPTGLALLALRGEPDVDGRIGLSVEYLRRELNRQTTTASLSYGLLGLASRNIHPANAELWLRAAADRTLQRDASGYKLGLLALAALGPECPLVSGNWQVAAQSAEAGA
jgi:hypothetical protein